MSTAYQINNQAGTYFLTLTVVRWVDIFSRKIYRDIILESLTYCRNIKGLRLSAYVIMTNHVHMIVSAEHENLSNVIRDFKRHTSTNILSHIQTENESRREWMLSIFSDATKAHHRNKNYQFWQHGNYAIGIDSMKFLKQKMAYIHLNPVRAGFVNEADDWLYSSQRNYTDRQPLIGIDMMDI